MEIVNLKKDTSLFEELKPGEVFYEPFEEWYGMALSESFEATYNAVILVSGELTYMAAKDPVVKVKARLKVSD